MQKTDRRIVTLVMAFMALAAGLWIILPALAERGDYGVNTGSSQSTPARLEPTNTRVAPPPTNTSPPPTNTPVPPPTNTPAPPTSTSVPTQHPDCKPGHYLYIAPNGDAICVAI